MSAFDTLCFADFDPVTGAPSPPDGFVMPDLGVNTNQVDPGYVNGSRMTFGGSGFPAVVFQGVRNGNTNSLHIGIFCRFDLSFDAEDVFVLAVRPSQAAADPANTRRIDIFPVYEGVGADEKSGSGTMPAGTKDDDDPANPANKRTVWGMAPGDRYEIRTDHVAQRLTFYRGQTAGNPWVSYVPASPAAFGAKVRSWKPPVPTGSPTECAWSIEIVLPVNTAGGGADWINLADGFGLYFNVIRVGKTPASGPTPSQTWFSTQFRFPVVGSNQQVLTGFLDETLVIGSNWYGTGLIPGPGGLNRGQGVRFHDDLSVGRRPAGSTTLTLGHQISGTADNELVAIVDNTSPSSTSPAGDAVGVTAEFRFANWGLGSPSFTSWAKPPGLSPNPSTGVTVNAGTANAALVSNWPAASVPTAYRPPKDHQCVWVQLSSASAVNFIQSSLRRNMDFISLSTFERDAEVSGHDYPSPATGTDHDFLLVTHARRIVTRKLREGSTAPIPETIVRYVWVTEGLRRTGLNLNILGRDTEVLDDSPGAFGVIAEHQGVDDRLEWELTHPDSNVLKNNGDGTYALKVPHNGTVTIGTRLETKPPSVGGSKLPWWAWLVLLLLLLSLLFAVV